MISADVFAGRQAGDEIVELEDEADVISAVASEARVVELGELPVAVKDRSASRRVEPAQNVQQRALAASRRAQQDDEFAPIKIEIHAPQRMHVDFAHVVDLGDPACGKDRFQICCRFAPS